MNHRNISRIYSPARQIVQLTSLRPTADLFCALLRDSLKLELERGQMKLVKSFAKTCYSEVLINSGSTAPDNEHEDGSLIQEKDGGSSSAPAYHGGLGLKFKFPGDPRKSVPEYPASPPTDSILGYVKRLKSNSGPPT